MVWFSLFFYDVNVSSIVTGDQNKPLGGQYSNPNGYRSLDLEFFDKVFSERTLEAFIHFIIINVKLSPKNIDFVLMKPLSRAYFLRFLVLSKAKSSDVIYCQIIPISRSASFCTLNQVR